MLSLFSRRLPLQMVWCEVCGVVQRHVVRRKSTALANVMRHQIKIYPAGKNNVVLKAAKIKHRVPVILSLDGASTDQALLVRV